MSKWNRTTDKDPTDKIILYLHELEHLRKFNEQVDHESIDEELLAIKAKVLSLLNSARDVSDSKGSVGCYLHSGKDHVKKSLGHLIDYAFKNGFKVRLYYYGYQCPHRVSGESYIITKRGSFDINDVFGGLNFQLGEVSEQEEVKHFENPVSACEYTRYITIDLNDHKDFEDFFNHEKFWDYVRFNNKDSLKARIVNE